MLWALGTGHGHRSPCRCEGVKFQAPKAVSMTLKEDYSIPERCLSMRDMLKNFRGKGAAFVPAPGMFGLWSGLMVEKPSLFWSWMGCEVTLKLRRSLRSSRLCVTLEPLLSVLAVPESVLGAAEPHSF